METESNNKIIIKKENLNILKDINGNSRRVWKGQRGSKRIKEGRLSL
jgi:hypothetical protein